MRRQLQMKWYAVIAFSVLHTVCGVLSVKAFAFLETGDAGNMSLFGGVFFMPVLYFISAKVSKRNIKAVFDIFTICMIFTVMCARINCIVSGCCAGLVIPGTHYHFPTRELEILYYIVMLILLIPRVKKSKNPGSIYPLYMASYGAFRFIDEFFRTSSTGMLFHLSHVWAAIAFAAGLSIYMLAEKKSAEPGVLRVSTEKNLYQYLNLQIKSDLFVSSTEGVTLFEAKAGGSKAEDLYQLRMYHDGCVADDMEVREAVLIAQRHPDTVKALLAELNRQKDKKGRPYHFALSTWDEEGIVLPPDAA